MASQKPGNSSHAYKQGEPLAKRRRIGLACTACRIRKSRCDGRRPSCSTCSTLALECQYEPADSATNVLVQKEHISNLEQRLKAVERALQRHDDLLTGHLSGCSTTAADASPSGTLGDHLNCGTAKRVQDGIHLDPASAEHPAPDEAKTDGLAIVFVDEKDPEFHGETSNVVFIRFLLRAVSGASSSKENAPAVPNKDDGTTIYNPVFISSQSSASNLEAPKSTQISPSELPVAAEMDALLNTYFTVYGSLFPFLHEPTFRDMYNDCKVNGFTKVRRTWLGLLNMMFAMASNVDLSSQVPAKERFRKSQMFFLRAVSLCGELSMRTVSLDIVQYLLLNVLYLQGTQRSVQAWNLHGMLVRTAIALGLQSEKSGQGLDPIQQEIRRRTWLTIYCLDNLLSVTYGRSPSILVEHVVVQLPSPWKCNAGMSQHQPNGPDINTEFLNATVRLHQIMGRSVADQYGLNLGLTDQDMDESAAIQAANAMRQELRRWTSSLPQYLSLCKPGSEALSETTDANRLRVILTLRHHFASILIHRPLLYATLRYLTTKEGSGVGALPYRIQLAMAEAYECIHPAEDTLEIVHTVLMTHKTGYSNLGVWFFTLFYVFTSSLVILGRSILSQHGMYNDNNTPGRSARSLLTKAIESLDKLDRGNDLVYNCARFIRHLSERQIDQAHPEQHDTHQRPNVEAEIDGSAYEQDLAVLVAGDLEMAQASMPDMFDPFFEDFGFMLRANDDDRRKREEADYESNTIVARGCSSGSP